MIKKIEEGLKQKYKAQYGLSDSDWSEIATLGAITVTDEAQIPLFVEGVAAHVRNVQSRNDIARSAQGQGGGEQIPAPDVQPNGNADVLALLQTMRDERVADQKTMKDLQDKLNAITGKETLSLSISQAKASFDSNAATAKYVAEASDAWERTLERNEDRGGKMTADELTAMATYYFDKAASRVGYDSATFVAGDSTTETGGSTIDCSKAVAVIERNIATEKAAREVKR